MKTVCVIHFRYHDGSGSGVIAAYEEETEARALLSLLEAHGDGMKIFLIQEVQLHEVKQ